MKFANKKFIFSHFGKLLLLLFCFNPFSSYVIAEGYDDDYEDEDYEEIKCFSRYSFLTTCEAHFANNIATAHTWMEADDIDTIISFNKYLQFIPKVYLADCHFCPECGGIGFYRNSEIDWPTESASEELEKFHEQHRRLGKRCKRWHDGCSDFCWNGGYFRRWNKKYINFFSHFLQYCLENQICDCYWPELNVEASDVNNLIYELLYDLADKELISSEFSSEWKAKLIEFDYYTGKIYGDEYYPNSHGIASSLLTYTFFYSQYHQMLLSIASFIDVNDTLGNSKAIDQIYSVLEEIRKDFSSMYNRCLRTHAHPKIYYERGMLKMHSGEIEGALSDISRLINLAKSDKNPVVLTSEIYQQEGKLYTELGMYDKALSALTEAIKLDPNNKGAYFDRAQAYFEIGQFDQSLNDHLSSENHSRNKKNKLKPSWDVKDAVLNGLKTGCKEAVIDFAPSLCKSIYGLGTALWVLAEHPINATTNFVNVCYDVSKITCELLKEMQWNDIESYPVEIRRLYDHFDKLSDIERAHLIGYSIGKYGVDIFAGSMALKSFTVVKNLKDANKLCNLEAMAVSAGNKEVILASAQKHLFLREHFFKNVKIHIDKQNKHIVGKHNYIAGKSIFEHPDPQRLLETFAGKGHPLKNRIPGKHDYRERIDFGEFVGYHVNVQTKTKTRTTWGEIRYSKDGAHIVPAFPE